MKKVRLFLLLLMAMVMPLAMFGQSTLTVNDGTVTNQYIPFDGFNADNAQHNQILYPASDLADMDGKAISQMVFYFNSSYGSYSAEVETGRLGTWVVSLGETTATTLSALDNTTATTQVYSGIMTWNHTDLTLTITFDNDYMYHGGNLLVDFNHEAASWCRYYFLGVTTTDEMSYNSNSSAAYSFLPKVTFTYGTPSSCPKPTDLAYSNVTATSVDLSWTAGGSETEWTLEVNGTEMTGITTNPYTLTVTPATNYTVKVKANCTTTEASNWTTPITFTTPCVDVTTLPWMVDFESHTANAVPTCWDNSASTTSTLSTNPERVWGVYAYEDNQMMRMYNYYVQTGVALINTPTIVLPSNETYALSFKYSHLASCDAFTVSISNDGGATFVEKGSYGATATSYNYTNPGTFVDADLISLGEYAGQSIIVQFRVNANYGSGAIFVDDVNIDVAPSCMTPSNLACTGYTTTTASFSWNPGNDETVWTLEYSTDENFADAQSVTVTSSEVVTPASVITETLNGLTAETTYYAHVKANCGETDASDWSNVVTFTPSAILSLTLCDGSNTNSYVPFYSLYCDDVTQSQFIYPATDLADMTWASINGLTFYNSTANASWGDAAFDVYMAEVPYTAFETAEFLDWNTFANVYTGSVSVVDNKMVVTFDENYIYQGGNLLIGFDINTQGTYSSTSWLGLTQTENTAVRKYSSYSPAFATFLPKVTISYMPGEMPSCLAPTIDTVYDITTTTATISWTDVNTTPAPSYTIMLNDEEISGITGTTYTFTTLTPATAYTVKVKANCAEDDESAWSLPVMLYTNCLDVYVVTAENPFHEGFENEVICWSIEQEEDADSWWISSGSNAYEGNNYAVAPYTPGNVTRLVSPVLDLTQVENPVLSYYHFQAYYQTYYLDVLTVYYRTSETSDWVLLADYADSSYTNYVQEILDLPEASATYQISFLATSNDGYNILLDDINITGDAVVGPCATPTNVAVSEANVVTWEGNAANYNVIIVVGEDTVVNTTVNTNSYTVEGLNAGDHAAVSVQAVCAEDNLSDWSTPVEFDYTVGIKNHSIQASIYPNPTTGNVTVESNAINSDITVYDMFGKLMMTSKVASERTELDFSSFAPGVYMIRIANTTGTTTIKVVKE